MTLSGVIGWDVGGANLKAVRRHADGSVEWGETPFELWRDPAGLAPALRRVARDLAPAELHGVTMTAELADCFASKRAGVEAVLEACRRALGDGAADVRVLTTSGRFTTPAAAAARPLTVAGANWAASARWLVEGSGLVTASAVLLDLGSTTADLIPLADEGVLARGRTDLERLVERELVYVGATRTPVCALIASAPLRGHDCPVAAEHFAIAADAHVWLGRLDSAEYRCATPDGAPTTRAACRIRLARVVCADGEMLDDDEVTTIARCIVDAQVERLAAALRRVARRLPGDPRVLIAGSGAELARDAADRAGIESIFLHDYVGPAARVLSAYAVAALLAAERTSARPVSAHSAAHSG